MSSFKKFDAKRTKRRWIAAVGAFCAVLLVALALYSGTTNNLAAQGEESLRQVILNSAKQCAAVEGSYPSSLDYLEKKYGLSVNHKDYLVTYEVFASNVPPQVTVSAR